MAYEEFWLDLIPVDDEVHVSLHDSPSGEASPFNARLPAVEAVERLAADFELVRGRRDYELAAAPVESLEKRLAEIGRQLATAIFQDSVRDRWMASCGRGLRPDRPLRLRLQMPIDGPGGARLHAMPWECWWAPSGDVAALDASFSLVRHVVAHGRAAPPPPRPRPLVVLVVASQAPNQPRLDLEGEIDVLRRLDDGGGLHVEVLDEPSLGSLRRRLDGGPVHVLHFLGHGGFDPVEERGVVFLPRTGGGEAEAVSGSRLASVLQAAPSLRLVFLNACRTAAAAEGSPFAGVATAIVRKAGMPAVVAMQYPIPDRSAILFARVVYGRLAAGEGIDAAVSEGRRRLYHEQHAAWVVPVLFSRQRGGLFAEAKGGGEGETRPVRWGGRRRAVAAMVLVAAVVLAVLGGFLAWSAFWPAEPTSPALGLLETGAGEAATEPASTEPAPPASDRPQTLTCGEPIHFAVADAYVGCSLEAEGSESYLSLTLRLTGKSYPARAVLGATDVAFPGPPDAVVSVADVDLEAGRLTVFPPTLAEH